MMATQDEVTVLRDDIAEVKHEVVLVRRDQQAHEERVDARFALMEERAEARFALMEERMRTWAQELKTHFETEIRRAITVQTLIQTATMVGLVWAARG